jgi:pimeloyl-ACP methyl ester carboxylesterase
MPAHARVRPVPGKALRLIRQRARPAGVADLEPVACNVGEHDHGSATGASHRIAAEAMAAKLPNSRFAVVSNEAHNYFMTNPEQAHRMIREFLTAI